MVNRNSHFGKKGIATQSFNIITAVVIMGIILIFGGTSVYKLVNNAADVEQVKFRNTFNSEINDISSKYGSVKYLELTDLRSYEYFCIFDLDNSIAIESKFDSDEVVSAFPLILGDIEDKTANVFLISNTIEERFVNEKITVSDEKGFICEQIPDNGVVKLKLEGLGKKVRISFAS